MCYFFLLYFHQCRRQCLASPMFKKKQNTKPSRFTHLQCLKSQAGDIARQYRSAKYKDGILWNPNSSGGLGVYVCVWVCVCVRLSLSRVQLFATPWTVAHKAPLSMGILQARILEWVAMPSSHPKCIYWNVVVMMRKMVGLGIRGAGWHVKHGGPALPPTSLPSLLLRSIGGIKQELYPIHHVRLPPNNIKNLVENLINTSSN